MQFVMFTKLLKDLDTGRLADTIQDLGFDGFDLAYLKSLVPTVAG